MIFSRVRTAQASQEMHPVRTLYLERLKAERAGKPVDVIEAEIDKRWTERVGNNETEKGERQL